MYPSKLYRFGFKIWSPTVRKHCETETTKRLRGRKGRYCSKLHKLKVAQEPMWPGASFQASYGASNNKRQNVSGRWESKCSTQAWTHHHQVVSTRKGKVCQGNAYRPPDRRNEHKVDGLVHRVLVVGPIEAQLLFKVKVVNHSIAHDVKQPKTSQLL
jgi:hypothetical protein